MYFSKEFSAMICFLTITPVQSHIELDLVHFAYEISYSLNTIIKGVLYAKKLFFTETGYM